MINTLYTNVHQTIKLHKRSNRQISIITLQKYVEYFIERVKFSIHFVSLLQLHQEIKNDHGRKLSIMLVAVGLDGKKLSQCL